MMTRVLPFPDYLEPPLPDDLPAGEAKRVWVLEVWGRPATHPPQSAPGFTRAWRMGILPTPAAATPPQPVPGLTARRRLVVGAILSFVSVGALAMLGDRLPVLLAVPMARPASSAAGG